MTRPGTQLDLDALAERLKLEIKIATEERVEELSERLAQQSADAKLNRMKDVVLVALAVVFIIALGTSCLAISVSHETTVEDKKWAWSTLTLITGAVLGFLFGRAYAPR